jgi:hypothetical protein
MKHTPGPWGARGYDAGAAPQHGNAQPHSIWIDCLAATKSGKSLGGTIAEVYKNGTGSDDPAVQHANAHLIAAAPDLLDVARTVIALQEVGTIGAGCTLADVAARARAAIAKATGETLS